jgi:predicted DNA-binding protein
MVTSVRMEPLLEKEIELAAKKLGVTKSQFIIDAVERALGRKNPFELMMKIKAEEAARADPAVDKAFRDYEQPYETVASRKALVKRLKEKHRASSTG